MARAAHCDKVIRRVTRFTSTHPPRLYVMDILCLPAADLTGNEIGCGKSSIIQVNLDVLFHKPSPCC